MYVRRMLLGLAMTLVVTGWGLTRWADAQVAVAASGRNEAVTAWTGERMKASAMVEADDFVPGRTLYVLGLTAMGIGTTTVVLLFPRGAWVPGG